MPGETKEKVPPNQVVAVKWPVLHEGEVPRYQANLAGWTFKSFGEVEQEMSWEYPAFLALGHQKVRSDFHCVTKWSLLDRDWEGVPFKAFLEAAHVKPTATHVLAHGEGGYTTNVALSQLLRESVMFVHRWNGAPLTPEHGYPLRLFVPHLYAWKSCKWIRGIEFLAGDRPGFWERRGYHMRGDPWREERYGTPSDKIED